MFNFLIAYLTKYRKLSKTPATDLIRDKRAEGSTNGLIAAAIGITMAFLVFAYIFPVGTVAIYDVNFSEWNFSGESEDVATTSLVKLLPLFGVLAFFIMIITVAVGKF